ncbi:MAG: hypothetical protein WD738_11210 [Pirellulales bacterium]
MGDTFFKTLFDNWIVTIVLICVLASVITSLAKQMRKYGCHRSETELKRDLVERGLSVDEIERIIAAKGNLTSKESG